MTAYEKVKEVGPRLPENLRMWSMQTAFDAVTDRWRAVKWTQQRADSAASEVDKWEAESLERGTHERVLEVARKNLLSARKELADASTARDAARLSLREALQPAREQVKGYVEELDRMDRRPK